MQGEPPTKASTPTGAVFLSYASQDAGAAQRICEALRAGGIEVWFDQSELRGGDAWDHRIREQIHDCRLFIPVISASTERRDEGYFRREWAMAVDRTRDMAHKRAFLVPVVIDGTSERGASVPDKFHELQWTRLPLGETPPAFVERIGRLLTSEVSPATAGASAGFISGPISAPSVRQTSISKAAMWGAGAIAAVACVYLAVYQFWFSKHSLPAAPPAVRVAQQTAPSGAAAVAFNPPPHSIAVLPFVNMSGDKDQEYFSDGLTEELLNSLARITELQVSARTSSFYFKGEHADLATIAHKLNVASVLEGSVRRSGHTVRVTAQLNNAVTGFHLWSQTYDRDLGDVLKLQTEIADAVTSALKITLLGGAAEKVQLGGTRNPAAFDAYLRGLRLARITPSGQTAMEECRAHIDAFSEAIDRDPNYALAYARRALVQWDCINASPDWLRQPGIAKGVRKDAERAIEIAPDLADGYVALSNLEVGLLNLSAADRACTHALALAPSDDEALNYCSWLAVVFGRTDAGITLARRCVALDPLNPRSYRALGVALLYSRHYSEATAAYQDSIALGPEDHDYWARGMSYYLADNLSEAQASCEVKPEAWYSLACKAMIYQKLGRREDASAALRRAVEQGGDAGGYQYAEIYAQWGENKAALKWLEKAMSLRDPGLALLRTDPLIDPLRKEPRFQAVMRELRFPD
jgi:TolB-like protein/tetratricopeptide (TPR) repeat protein